MTLTRLRRLFKGWGALRRLYPDQDLVVDRTFSESSLDLGGSLFGRFSMCIDVEVGDYGIRLSVVVLSVGPLRSPIVLPWTAIESCTRARLWWFFEALRITVQGWPEPILLGRFLWKYGDAYSYIIKRWQQAGVQGESK